MINSKEELDFFLDADKFALEEEGTPSLFRDEVWKFQISLRKCEYYKGKGGLGKILFLKHKIRKRNLGIKLGFGIQEGVFGAGLRINHFGNIIVNSSTKVGRWCDIHQGVNIGASNPETRTEEGNYTPTIGDNVWIGPGSKIYGGITIGSRVQIGANAVVGKSFGEDLTLGGVPAKIIGDKGTSVVDISVNPNRTKQFFIQNPQYKKFENMASEA